MLKPAQLYKEQLQKQMMNTWYNPKYIYYTGGTGDCEIQLGNNTYEKHDFVSLDKDENVIGYIDYTVDWNAMAASRMGAISFQIGNLLFVRDLYEVIQNIFKIYHMNKLSWWCFADNPAIKGYRNFVQKYGGTECGYHRQAVKLRDGRLHDIVDFEILAEDLKNGIIVNDEPTVYLSEKAETWISEEYKTTLMNRFMRRE